ncbi:hypothetical protein SLS55_008506 [Diplodia seriata]|uniref:Cytochrome P450 n=1 Tax=Diplodia seriata TaxID=420778 RepID=A0ABR3C6K3_9PEZI
MFYLLSAPETMGKLRVELEAAIPTASPSAMPPWTTLEQLPYLNACVHTIPPRYTVGMSAYQIHHDEALFPESRKYQPERWLDGSGKRDRYLDPYLLSFSKGSRQFLGMNLAYAELFTLLAMLIRCYGHHLELFETTAEDVDFHHDAIIPAVKPGSKGIRVLVK